MLLIDIFHLWPYTEDTLIDQICEKCIRKDANDSGSSLQFREISADT